MSEAPNGLIGIGIGILSAIAASLCCIIPVLALIAGSSGLASAFSWLEHARPYLIGITVLVLGFAWYRKLKPQKQEDCCAPGDLPDGKAGKPKFIQSKTFLMFVTIFAALMVAFPFYLKIFYSNSEKQVIVIDKSNLQTAVFQISGMTCESCEQHVEHEVNKLVGIIKTEVSYKNTNAEIQFDSTKTNLHEMEKAINSTGYKVTKSEIYK